MLQFVFLRNADTFENFRETCIEYADNQTVFASQGEQIIGKASSGKQEVEKKFKGKLRKR